MSLFSLICHYRVSFNDNEETLRTYFENMYKRPDRDVRSTLDNARKKLLEASELKIDMRWTTTGKKIYDRLAHNNHSMATALAMYKDMTLRDYNLFKLRKKLEIIKIHIRIRVSQHRCSPVRRLLF